MSRRRRYSRASTSSASSWSSTGSGRPCCPWTDRRLARQRHQDEVQRAQSQVETFFKETVLKHRMVVDTRKVGEIKWPHDNAIFANALLRADEEDGEEETNEAVEQLNGIPIGPSALESQRNGVAPRKHKRSVLYPAHKAFLIRKPLLRNHVLERVPRGPGFRASAHNQGGLRTRGARDHTHVLVPPRNRNARWNSRLIFSTPPDMLLLDKLKTKAAIAISTLGSGSSNALVDRTHAQAATGDEGGSREMAEVEVEAEPINVYDVIHAAWDLKVQRLEEFAAKYLASETGRLIDEVEFAELIQESASRLKETGDRYDRAADDIRYYLSERFRLRFEGEGPRRK